MDKGGSDVQEDGGSTGSFHPEVARSRQIQSPGDPLDINGVLLEYVITTKLQRGPIDRDEISSGCQEAVDLVKTVGEYGVLNKDVRLDNILVRTKVAFPPSIPDPPATATPSSFLKRFISYLPTLPTRLFRHNSPLPALRPSPCYSIDFASCRLRYKDETDEEWRRAKQSQDEEGAIGSVLEWLLKECSKGRRARGSRRRLRRRHCTRPGWWWRTAIHAELDVGQKIDERRASGVRSRFKLGVI